MVSIMAEFPSMPLWTDAFIADTTHLNSAETGAYIMLLICMWRSGGYIPNEDKKLSRFARCTPAQWKRIKPIIMEFLIIDECGITQKNLLKTLSNVQEKVTLNRHLGSLGGKAKALKYKDMALANATPNAIATKTITKTKEDKKENIKRKSSYPNDFIPSKDNAETYWKQKSRSDLNYEDQVIKFASHCKANGKQFVCWQSAWTTWYGNAVSFSTAPKEKELTTIEKARIYANGK
jgi:uncharacterized protein YdaU (DUF1376 family)